MSRCTNTLRAYRSRPSREQTKEGESQMNLNESELRSALDRYRRKPAQLKEPAQRAIQELDAFLGSEVGKLAVQMLEASGQTVRLFEPGSEDSHYEVFLINGQGLVKESGFVTASMTPRPPHTDKTTPKELVEVIERCFPSYDYSAMMKMIERNLKRIMAEASRLFIGSNSQS